MSKAAPRIDIPHGVAVCAEILARAGGRAFLVGGAVRDSLLERPMKDYDLEVFGLSYDAVRGALAAVARVEPVGDSFPVFKVAGLPGIAGQLDVALPRRDSRKGPGHRGIEAQADPNMPIEEAARRRDFTINAMMFDLVTGILEDPFGGEKDLSASLLRVVDESTFGDDPLRALRAAQFAARFELRVEEGTARLCASMPLHELPADRIFGEVEKALLQARRPSIAFRLLAEWDQLRVIAPELVPLAVTPQDPEWHPEGDVWTHTLLALDEARRLIDDLEPPRALAVMLGTLCHDLGKPETTKVEDGRIRSRGHEEAGVAPTLALLDRWNVHTRDSFPLRDQIVALVKDHLKPGALYQARSEVSAGAIRRLARRVESDLLYRVATADCLGRTGDFAPLAMEWFIGEVRKLSVERAGPLPLLRGRDLLNLGVKPGPAVGKILNEVYERQLDSLVQTRDEALRAARTLLGLAPS
ncbi:MAG: HD domain-containing protein [Vicinamibacteria bacterium]|nr:HD domain-containing protein [Vicinamibacteria bacterium]